MTIDPNDRRVLRNVARFGHVADRDYPTLRKLLAEGLVEEIITYRVTPGKMPECFKAECTATAVTWERPEEEAFASALCRVHAHRPDECNPIERPYVIPLQRKQ